MRRPIVYLAIICLATTLAAPTSGAQTADDVDRASEELSIITERYNEARLARRELDAELDAARSNLARSEDHLARVRGDLGTVVRDLYMHPAAGLQIFFAAESYRQLQRGNDLASRVALSAEGLILQIRRIRAEQEAATGHLERLRDEARSVEADLADRQDAAEAAHERAQRALARTNTAARDAARRDRLEEAGSLAAERITAGPSRAGASQAVAAAASQIGKPYRWGAEGPDAYDCSGLTMYAWARGGVSLPHSSRAQYASLPKVSMSELAPGDLVFRGNPIHHVAIYKGGGVVIHAPQSGETVREDSLWSQSWNGAARP